MSDVSKAIESAHWLSESVDAAQRASDRVSEHLSNESVHEALCKVPDLQHIRSELKEMSSRVDRVINYLHDIDN